MLLKSTRRNNRKADKDLRIQREGADAVVLGTCLCVCTAYKRISRFPLYAVSQKLGSIEPVENILFQLK